MSQHIAWFRAGVSHGLPAVVNVNKAIQVNKGQGEGETKWKGCAWKLLLIKFVIFIYNYYKLPMNNLRSILYKNNNTKNYFIHRIFTYLKKKEKKTCV